MRVRTRPVGRILAGGGGPPDRRRQGDRRRSRAAADLLSAGGDAGGARADVAILAKADTELPYALGRRRSGSSPSAPPPAASGSRRRCALAGGRPVLVCAADLPFVTRRARSPARQGRPGPGAGGGRVRARAACSRCSGCYQPRAALPLLGREAVDDTRPLERGDRGDRIRSCSRSTIPSELFDVNSPDDLLQAAAMLDRAADCTRRVEGPRLAEREVVGADAGRQLHGERELLGRRATRPASTGAGRCTVTMPFVTSRRRRRPGSACRRAAPDRWRGTLPAEVITR